MFSTSWRPKCLHKLFGIFLRERLVYFYWMIYSPFIYISTDRAYLCCTLHYNLTLLCFPAQTVSASAIGSTSVGSWVSHMLHHGGRSFLGASLLSDTTRCFRLILCISYPSSGLQPFLQGSLGPLLEERCQQLGSGLRVPSMLIAFGAHGF